MKGHGTPEWEGHDLKGNYVIGPLLPLLLPGYQGSHHGELPHPRPKRPVLETTQLIFLFFSHFTNEKHFLNSWG